MWPFKKTKLNIQLVHRDSTKLKLSEWQADDKLCNTGAKVLNQPEVQLMLQVVRNENPSLWSLVIDCTLDTRALHQARIEGYNMALRNFESLSAHKALQSELTATFEEEEK